MKKHKNDTGKQNRKRPAEAAESFTQVVHDGGIAVNYHNRSSTNSEFTAVVCLSALLGPLSITSAFEALVVSLGILRSRGTGSRCSKGLRDIVRVVKGRFSKGAVEQIALG
jgi:hypothetical protein